MQQIYGPGNASNVLLTAQKRLIRPAYAQTQGYPYATFLDPSLRNGDNSIRVPANGDTAGATAGQGTVPLTRTAAAYTYQGSLIPGLCMVKNQGENVAVHNGGTGQTFGLLAQWVGGIFDNLGQISECSVWLGPDSVYELLAPAWNDTQVATSVAAAGAGAPVALYAQTDGRLGSTNPGSGQVVATVVDRPSSARLLIKLAI
jgi:hypothetical protein